MGKFNLSAEPSPPSTPDAGRMIVYHLNKKLYSIDEDGVIVDLTAVATNTLVIEGSGLVLAYREITADYTLVEDDYTVNCTDNSFTVTLPVAGISGATYQIKNTGTGIITVATTGGQTIDGKNSGEILLTRYENLTVQATGTNWIIL